MGYDVFSPDTSTRRKLLGIADQFSPDINPYYDQIRNAGNDALQKSFASIYGNVGAQFSPAMRMAQARLGGSPLLADSGYANRLNRQIQTSAFSDVARGQADAAAQMAQGQQSALERLIATKLGARQDILSTLFGSAQKKKNFGDYAAQLAGAGLSAYAGSKGG